MKKKIVLSAAFVCSLLPMLLDQYGGQRGVQEISGLINLFNPIGIASAAIFCLGVWAPLKRAAVGAALRAAGAAGVVVSEVYTFFTWHVMNITGEMSVQNSVRLAFPEFYLGLTVSLAMLAACFVIDRKMQ